MAQKEIKVHIQLRAASHEDWGNVAQSIKPLANELIIYLPDANHPNHLFKLGDGTKYIDELDFIDFTDGKSTLIWNEF